jgi:phospholipid N-methyltransferase
MQLFLLLKEESILKKHFINACLSVFLFSFDLFGSEALIFFKEFCLHPGEVGAIAATSSYTGDELCHYITFGSEKKKQGLRILEIGGGCGNVSKIISGHMREADQLDIIEINPDFCQKIEKKVSGKPNVSVQCCSILDWQPSEKYDLIISTLPFNSFSYPFFLDVFAHICSLGAVDVVFSYVEYVGLGQVKDLFLRDKDVKQIKEFLKTQHENKNIRTETVWLNLPPIQIYHLKINE